MSRGARAYIMAVRAVWSKSRASSEVAQNQLNHSFSGVIYFRGKKIINTVSEQHTYSKLCYYHGRLCRATIAPAAAPCAPGLVPGPVRWGDGLSPAVLFITPSDGVKSDDPLVVVLRRVEVLDAVLRYVAGVRIAGTIQWDHDEVSESFEGVSREYLGE